MAGKGKRGPQPSDNKLRMLGVYMRPDELERLKEMAKADRRPVSAMAAVFIQEGMDRREAKS